MEIITNSNLDTQKLGEALGKRAFAGMIIALSGDVGAGKTEFTKGFTVGANSDNATSPTFAIMNMYEGGKFPIYHFDFYRCGGDIEEFEEYIFGDGVAIIEWSELIDLPKDIIAIDIAKIDDETRKITLNGNGKYEELLRGVVDEYSCH